ncbi:MAG: FkbM family methyltransferase [Spartobacteria bacterium]
MLSLEFRTYIRELIEDFPGHAMRARREWGMTGIRIACAAYLSRSAARPIASPVGKLATHNELLNFLDNFCANELRCSEVEACLDTKEPTTVVDLGINVGVSARWWLTRSAAVRVIGIDMIAEALEFASERIAEMGLSNRWEPIHSAVGDRAETIRVAIDDPLEGTTSLLSKHGSEYREVQIQTLDNLLENLNIEEILLLKIDIEGYGGFALQRASQTLRKTRYVCIECHDDAETELSGRRLVDEGFVLFKIKGRHMWWRRLGLQSLEDTRR